MHQYPTVRGRVVFIRYRPTVFGRALVIHNNFSNRMAPCRRWIIQVSALSALDGSVLDIISETFIVSSSTNLISLFVIIPTNF